MNPLNASQKQTPAIQLLGSINITKVQQHLQKHSNLWPKTDFRQQRFEVHKETQSLVLMWSENALNQTRFQTFTHKRNYTMFADFIEALLKILHAHYLYEQPKVFKCMFARLPAGKQIYPHIDKALDLRLVQRIHVPIVTHPKVRTVIDDKEHPLIAGNIYDFNNTMRHSVQNNSAIDRIHMIIDYADEAVFHQRFQALSASV